jgi:glucose-6-phosphate dehydrogenase assembly protein OpcA
MRIEIENTLDVEIVERQFAELWQQAADDPHSGHEAAVLRARVANLLVFVPSEALSHEVDEMLRELTAIHPSRVLMMLGHRNEADHDIEMSVTSFCQTDKRTGTKRLCCEEVTLKAQGSFVVELPSAALPLLVPDLATFIWWRDVLRVSDKVFDTLLQATDRLVIDSAEFADPVSELLETNQLFNQEKYTHVGISDLNWARLTGWRGLLADFYDVPANKTLLDEIDYVRVDYVAPDQEPSNVAPQAMLIAGWLASRLGWTLAGGQPEKEKNETLSFKFISKQQDSSSTPDSSGDRVINVHLNRVKRGERKPGRLVQVELRTKSENSGSFVVRRSEDGNHLLAEARLSGDVHRGRMLPVRNRSAAQLLSREMEILCNDRIYQEALAVAAKMIDW